MNSQIDTLLRTAYENAKHGKWEKVKEISESILTIDTNNNQAKQLLALAETNIFNLQKKYPEINFSEDHNESNSDFHPIFKCLIAIIGRLIILAMVLSLII